MRSESHPICHYFFEYVRTMCYSSLNNSCLTGVLPPRRFGRMIQRLACAILLSVAFAGQGHGAEQDVGALLQLP